MAYIDDVPPNGGGLQLWPGSHTRVFPTFARQHTSFRGEAFKAAVPPPRDRQETGRGRQASLASFSRGGCGQVAAVGEDTVPVDCYGPAGTVIFWHRLDNILCWIIKGSGVSSRNLRIM